MKNTLELWESKESYLREFIRSSSFDERFTNINKIFSYRSVELCGEECIVNRLGMLANIDSDGKVCPNIVEIGNLTKYGMEAGMQT